MKKQITLSGTYSCHKCNSCADTARHSASESFARVAHSHAFKVQNCTPPTMNSLQTAERWMLDKDENMRKSVCNTALLTPASKWHLAGHKTVSTRMRNLLGKQRSVRANSQNIPNAPTTRASKIGFRSSGVPFCVTKGDINKTA